MWHVEQWSIDELWMTIFTLWELSWSEISCHLEVWRNCSISFWHVNTSWHLDVILMESVEDLLNLVRGAKSLFNTLNMEVMALPNSCLIGTQELIGNKIPGSLSSTWATIHPFIYTRVKLHEVNTNILRSNLLRQ